MPNKLYESSSCIFSPFFISNVLKEVPLYFIRSRLQCLLAVRLEKNSPDFPSACG